MHRPTTELLFVSLSDHVQVTYNGPRLRPFLIAASAPH